MTEHFNRPYPTYDVLDKWDSPSWNEQTRRVVAKRLHDLPKRTFFTPSEWALLECICQRLVPQPDRATPVPITPWIDRKLHLNQGDGYRYADLPTQRQAWRQGLAAIADESVRRTRKPFPALAPVDQDSLLTAVQNGQVVSREWRGLPAAKFFAALLLTQILDVYYSHPAAWSEIGYGGPASPRGYVRMDFDRSDPWEAER
jgi:hypothetical protein